MANDGWKKIADAMRKREEELAYEAYKRMLHDEIAGMQLELNPKPPRKRLRKRI